MVGQDPDGSPVAPEQPREKEAAAAAAGSSGDGGDGDGAAPASTFSRFQVSLSQTAWGLADSLGFRRVQEYFSNASTSMPSSGSDAWLLGKCYGRGEGEDLAEEALPPKVLEEFARDFCSRLWMTYRRDFEAIPGSTLTGDQGWGCTLRSGQMMLAQALLFHYHGRGWRRAAGCEAGGGGEGLHEILSCFGDSTAEECIFSIHRICESGKGLGVVPGQWLGPCALCNTFKAIVDASDKCPFAAYLVSDPMGTGGGGAPTLYTDEVSALCTQEAGRRGGVGCEWAPCLLLVPLVLGPGREVNPRYLPQLRKLLELPQSVGIVGGRPGSSLYFVGYQDERVFYLDPHTVQPAGEGPGRAPPGGTCHCETVRHMPMAGVDTSMALAFYCGGEGEARDLWGSLGSLAEGAGGAPLLTVAARRAPMSPAKCGGSSEEGGGEGEDDWQLL